jgi:hypothetical protein
VPNIFHLQEYERTRHPAERDHNDKNQTLLLLCIDLDKKPLSNSQQKIKPENRKIQKLTNSVCFST